MVYNNQCGWQTAHITSSLIQETLYEMKIFVILWAIGLAECEKLDRIYLPPPSSVAAGGYSEDLNLPLEVPKQNYPPILESESNRPTADSSTSSNYPNIAIGIDRQPSYETTLLKFFTKRPEIPFSEITNNVPTTAASYEVTQTSSTFSPIRNYDTTARSMTTLSEEYSSATSLGPNPSYDQYLIQKNINQNKSQEIIPNLVPGDTKVPNYNISLSTSGLLYGNSNVQSKNFQQLPQNLSVNYASPDLYVNKSTFETYLTQQAPGNSDDTIANSQDYYDPTKAGVPSTLAPGQIFTGTLAQNAAFPSIRYTTNLFPQRIQAEGDRNAVILNYKNILTPEGFAYSFDTSNGVHIDESGTANNGVKAEGSYSYIGDDGNVYSIEYTADENGFVPRGKHLPTAPPIPKAILRGLEQAEKNKKLGIIDDGSYDDTKYGYGRYQGLMSSIQQKNLNKVIVNPPNVTENEEYSEKNTIQIQEHPAKNVEFSDKTTAKYEITSNTPNILKMLGDYKKDSYVVNNNNSFTPKYNGINQHNENLFNSEDVKDLNIWITNESQTKLRNFINDSYRNYPKFASSIENKNQNIKTAITNGDTFIPLNFSTKESTKAYDTDVNQRSDTIQLDSGYEYTKPQNTFNYNDNNNLESVLSTMGPMYASTTANPYNYQSPYTNENDKQRGNYPLSTFETQYAVSTTPLPSGTSSSVGNIRYPQTTPTSKVSSTLRPSIAFGSPETTSRRLTTGNMSRIEQPEDFKMSTINPNNSGRRITGRPEYRAGLNKIPITQEEFSRDLVPEFGVSIEPSSQNFEVSSQPENFRIQSLSQKDMSEDFSGPKQTQRFDSKFGYYY